MQRQFRTFDIQLPNIKAKSRPGRQTDVTAAPVSVDTQIRPSKEIIYETTKRELFPKVDGDDDYDDEFPEEDAKTFGRENVGSVASPYLMPYVYKRRFCDTQYGMGKDGDIFKIGDSAVVLDQHGDITIKGKECRGSEVLRVLLTRRTVNKKHVTSDYLRTYKKILLLTNAHLEAYQPGSIINVCRGKKFR